MSMSSRLFVRNLQSDVSLDDLIIYFQSSRSGGGDVQVEKCEMNGDIAVVVFEQEEGMKLGYYCTVSVLTMNYLSHTWKQIVQ